MSKTFFEKQNRIKELFVPCKTKEQIYKKIIEIGKNNPEMSSAYQIEENQVTGCQSLMYLSTSSQNGLMRFQVKSDAMISNGLAALLILAYNGEKPDVVLQNPPKFLEELLILPSLSPGRSNGVLSLYLKMKQESLKVFVQQNK